MTESRMITVVSIRPDVGVLSVLRHLNYKPWYALAEFVDNSLESFLRHQDRIRSIDGQNAKLRVEISIDNSCEGMITIRDNAAGIYENEYERAFRPAEPPPQINGLSEFGMGMKSAACWFGRKFSVRSCALDEGIERTVTFDIDDIVRTKSDVLPVKTLKANHNHHYTEVILSNLHKPPQGKTTSKIKEHLASIYRVFIQEGTLELRFRSAGVDEILRYDEPEILTALPADLLLRRRKLVAEPQQWKKDIEFDLGSGLKVSGFAALRKKASTATAGFALFRRKRLIEGSGEESYRPSQIFGASTTAVYQRLFGELHLEGFEVSHTKDGFKWDENEEPFLELLREHLNADPLPLIDQAKEARYDRLRDNDAELNVVVNEAVKDTGDILRSSATPVLEEQINSTDNYDAVPVVLLPSIKSWKEVFVIELNGINWQVTVEVTNDPGVSEWIRVFDTGEVQGVRQLGVSLSLANPFMIKFVGSDFDRIKPFVRLAAAIGLAEITARESGVRQAGEMRRNINQLLGDVLSKS